MRKFLSYLHINHLMYNEDYGLFVLRLGLGLLFLLAGFGKLTGILGPGIEGFAGMVWGMTWLAVLIGAGELLGGIGLITGTLTKWAAGGLMIIMAGAIVLVAFPSFDAANPATLIKLLEDVVVFTGLLTLVLSGPGELSFDEKYL